jgi:hypothetical protein
VILLKGRLATVSGNYQLRGDYFFDILPHELFLVAHVILKGTQFYIFEFQSFKCKNIKSNEIF